MIWYEIISFYNSIVFHQINIILEQTYLKQSLKFKFMNVHSFFISFFVQLNKLRMKNVTNSIWNVILILMALFIAYGGAQHFSNSAFYIPFVPNFLPYKMEIIYFSGVVEIAVALLLTIKKYRGIGTLALLILMIVFLPIHIWDVFSDTPAIGSHKAALIRLPIQLVFIGIAWKLKKINCNKK